MPSKALASGMSPVFIHSVFKGAISNMAVRRSLYLKPSAVIVGWSSIFISMQTAEVAFWHLLLTNWLYFLRFSDIDSMGNFGLLHPVNLLWLALPSRCSPREKVSKHYTDCFTFPACSFVFTQRASLCLWLLAGDVFWLVPWYTKLKIVFIIQGLCFRELTGHIQPFYLVGMWYSGYHLKNYKELSKYI